ncbi:hypothetical protein JG688_00008971 [Phytophthora aleatoria]|uniref:Uncharacterized protein n=1 Tax=Phytophthora aleatoria TaxID=2496075 RepID=A0A8J5J6F0_9STRA|nr:hypothetical protein JG688_00008971 [Phytophthora aleatoria]
MKDFTTSTSTLWVLLFLLHALGCHAAKTQLALSAGNSYMNFRFDVAQRCNSLDSCYAGRGSYASWLALKESTRIAFYAVSQCQGDYVTVNTSPRGTLKFDEVGFDKSVLLHALGDRHLPDNRFSRHLPRSRERTTKRYKRHGNPACGRWQWLQKMLGTAKCRTFWIVGSILPRVTRK